jgi:hypothetical protein
MKSVAVSLSKSTTIYQKLNLYELSTCHLASAFSFAQIPTLPFVQRAENKKLLKNGNKIGILVGYHLGATTQTQTKIFPRNFQKIVDFPSLKFLISERTFQNRPPKHIFQENFKM